MEPKISFRDSFSNEGRLKKLWARALNETDPEISFDLLRSVREKMHESPTEFVHLWLPFLKTLFALNRVKQLSHTDLRAIEAMGQTLLQVPELQRILSATELWLHLVGAYDMRGETALARALLTRIYYNPGVDEQTKSQCIQGLLQRNAINDEYLNLYIEHLRHVREPRTETTLLTTLEQLCITDFAAERGQLERTRLILQSLAALGLLPERPRFQIAQGISLLLIEHTPNKALLHFEQAYVAERTNHLALIGCLACWIQMGNLDQVLICLQNPQQRLHLQNPIIVGLLHLCKAIQWLDHTEVTGPLSYDMVQISHLQDLALQRYAGDIVHATLGRLFLLVGKAQEALDSFTLLTPTATNHPQWAYHTAWASILTGQPQKLAHSFNTLADWAGRWTLACLLLDTDPALATECGALALLQSIAETQEPQANAIRQKLADPRAPVNRADEKPGTGCFLEGELEMLRIRLTRTASSKDTVTLERLTWLPLFLRQPLAEQLFWKGLLQLLHQNQAQGLTTLEQTATTLGHRQAALFLCIHFSRQGNSARARPYLELALTEHMGARNELIQAYGDSQARPLEEAIQKFEQLTPALPVEANYILGNLYFYQASRQSEQTQEYRQKAAQVWHLVMEQEKQTWPADLKALELCASFLAYPQQRTRTAPILWLAWLALENEQRQPWIGWHATLAILWYGTAHELARASEDCKQIVNLANQLPPAATTVLAQALALAAKKAEHRDQASKLLPLLAQLEQQTTHPLTKQICQAGTSAALYTLYQQTSSSQRKQIEQNMNQRTQQHPGAEIFTFLLTAIYLKHNRRAEAIALLNAATPRQKLFAYLRGCMLELLAGRLPPLLKDTSWLNASELAEIQLFQEILNITRAFYGGQSEQGYKLLMRQQTARVLSVWKQASLFPAFSAYLLKNNHPLPTFFALLQPDQAQPPLASQTDAHLLSQHETVSKGQPAPDLPENQAKKVWQSKLARILCYQAVKAWQANETVEAIGRLRLAAYLIPEGSETPLSRQKLLEQARALELQTACSRLLATIFPELTDTRTPPGRYHYLGQIIAQSPALLNALLANEKPTDIQQKWETTLQEFSNDIYFLHTLSILYREAALSKQARGTAEENDWIMCTALWVLLLSSEPFWSYFADGRADEDTKKRPAMEIQQQQHLWQDALERLLSPYSATTTANPKGVNAHIQLSCLALCWHGEKRLRAAVQANGLSYTLEISGSRLAAIKLRVQKLLQEWSLALLTQAEQALNDAQTMQQHTSGLRKNYQKAIETLAPFLELHVPIKRILLTCLEWYNDWRNDLHLNTPVAKLREISDQAHKIAEQLIPLSTKKNNSAPENRALALHLTYLGNTLENTNISIKTYREAISWHPAMPRAEALLEKARLKVFQQQALAYAEQGQFDAAYQIIDQAREQMKDGTDIPKFHAQLCLQHGRNLAMEGRYTEAWSRGKQGYLLDPQNISLRQFMSEMEELKPEEESGRILKEAVDELEQRNFEGAIRILARIPRSSLLFKQAISLQISTCVQSAVDFTDKNQLDSAEEQLRRASKIDEAGEKQALIQQQLSTILTRKATEEIKRTHNMNINTQKGQIKSRNIYAMSLLEEAIELHPGNLDARNLLESL